MKCPFCSSLETKVIDSRLNQSGEITRRRRACQVCLGRFTTYERVEEIMPVVIKKDGRREPFDREKIRGGINKACQKLSIGAAVIEPIVSRIEKKIQDFGLKEIPARTVGDLVMIELHKLHKVAYIRFASVYRDFQDVDEFYEELKEPPTSQDKTVDDSLSFPFVQKESEGPKP